MEVANAGEKKVTIQGVKVVWGRRAAFFSEGIVGTRDWQFELRPGEAAKFWTPFEEFTYLLRSYGVSGKVKIKASFSDSVGTHYISKGFVIDVEELAEVGILIL